MPSASPQDLRSLAVLNEIAKIATEDLELDRMLGRIVSALREKFEWEFVAVVFVDLKARRFQCRAVSSTLPTEVKIGYSRPLGSGVVGDVALTGRPIVIDDVSKHANYVETLPGAKSEICVRSEERRVGKECRL